MSFTTEDATLLPVVWGPHDSRWPPFKLQPTAEFSSALGQVPPSGSSTRPRLVGGVLRQPLVRLTGQCTKLFSGTEGKGSPFSSSRSTPVSVVHAQRSSIFGQSIRSMIQRTQSLESSIAGGAAKNDLRTVKHMPVTQFSARLRHSIDSGGKFESPLAPPRSSPVHVPSGFKIRSKYLGGGGGGDGKCVQAAASGVILNSTSVLGQARNSTAGGVRVNRRESDSSMGWDKADADENQEDGIADTMLRSRRNMALCIRMGYLLLLLIPDVVTFLIFQVRTEQSTGMGGRGSGGDISSRFGAVCNSGHAATSEVLGTVSGNVGCGEISERGEEVDLEQVMWAGPVFLCHTEPASVREGNVHTWHGELDMVNVGVMSTVVVLHVWFLAAEVRAGGKEEHSGFRVLLSRERQGRWGTVVWNVIYLCVVAASVGVLLADAAECARTGSDGGVEKAERTHRIHLLVHLLRCICVLMLLGRLSGTLRRRLQSLVSMNKRRFEDSEQNLDLDLTYVCDRVIAMALPCVGDVLYRNDMRQVARFFASRHYGHFVVTNLCNAFEEGGNGNYDQALLYNQVQRLAMHDHNAPLMQTLVSFLEGAVTFLNLNNANVVAVHCKGGKGRTGTFCAALLLWTGCCHSAEEAMHLFATRRTRPCSHTPRCPLQGVDAPSQKRSLKYLERMIYEGVDVLSARSPLLLTSITLAGMAQASLRLCVMVEHKGVLIYDSGKAFGALRPAQSHWQRPGGHAACAPAGFDLQVHIDPVLLHHDVTVRVFLVDDHHDASRIVGCNGHVSRGGSRVHYQQDIESAAQAVKGRQLAFVSLHTAFHGDGDISFTKAEVDGAYQDDECRFFSPAFCVTLATLRSSSHDALQLIRMTNPNSVSGFAASAAASAGGRLPPALDAMRLEEALDALMQRLCPEEEEVLQGQVVFDSGQSCETGGQLCYLVSGQVSFSPVLPRDLRIYGRLGISCCPDGFTVGTGSLLGMLECSLGRGASPFGTTYTAKTERVTVRRFTLQSSAAAHGPVIPSLDPRLAPEDLDTIFKKIAQALCSWSASLLLQISLVTKMHAVKYDYTVGMDMSESEKAKWVSQIMVKHHIPMTEQVLVMCDVCIAKPKLRVDNTVDPSGTQGILLLFQRGLVFVPPSGQVNSEVLSTIKAISHTKLEEDKLVISFASPSQASNLHPSLAESPRQMHLEPSGLHQHLLSPSSNVLPVCAAKASEPRSPLASTPPLQPEAGSDCAPSLQSNDGRSLQTEDATLPGMARRLRTLQLVSVAGKLRAASVQPPEQEISVDIEIESDCKLVFTKGMETAIRVRDAIDKQRELDSEERAPAPLVLDCASELADIMAIARLFSLVLPDEELSTEDTQALLQLLSPAHRKRYLAGSQIFAKEDTDEVFCFVLAGTVSVRSGNTILVTMQVGELVGERCSGFWGQGNRGKGAKMTAETDVEVQWLEFERIELVCSGRPLVAARVSRCFSMCMGRRIQSQLRQLQQLETAIICAGGQDALCQ